MQVFLMYIDELRSKTWGKLKKTAPEKEYVDRHLELPVANF